MKVGIDTNVMIYYLDRDSPFHEECRKNLTTLVESQRAVLAQQNLVELAVVLNRRGVSLEQSEIYVGSFADSIPVLRPTLTTLKTFLNLLKKTPKKSIALFDLYFAATLISNQVNILYTYNEKDFSNIKDLKMWKAD